MLSRPLAVANPILVFCLIVIYSFVIQSKTFAQEVNPVPVNPAPAEGTVVPTTPVVQQSVQKPVVVNHDPAYAQQLAQSAMQMTQEGRSEEAIKLLDQAHKADPENQKLALQCVSALQKESEKLKAEALRKTSKYAVRAAQIGREMLKKNTVDDSATSKLNKTIYDEACVLAGQGKRDQALKSLEEAFVTGFEDVSNVRDNQELATLHCDEQFVALVNKYESIVSRKLADETRAEMKEFQSFDFGFQLKDVDGKIVDMKQFEGKILIVDFWGTWCPPCRDEIPHFIQLKNEYAEMGLEIVGLTYEQVEPAIIPQQIKNFVKASNINYPCLIGDDATIQKVPNIKVYPTMLFIDQTGKVRLMLEGKQSHAKLESVIKLLLGDGTPHEMFSWATPSTDWMRTTGWNAYYSNTIPVN